MNTTAKRAYVAMNSKHDATHTCHVRGCAVTVAPTKLMCFRHWNMVPPLLKTQVWRHFRPGQERDKNPTRDYLEAAKSAIDAVSMIEHGKRIRS